MFSQSEARKIVTDYAGKVRRAFDVDKIVLFGSYVNGTPHEWSDIDVGVVINNYNGTNYDGTVTLYKLRDNISYEIEPHLLNETKDPYGFCEHVLKTGEIIYQKQ
jgi:predicted nucleotidyltransferase